MAGATFARDDGDRHIFGAAAMTEGTIALLGRRDEPTDAVEEYCRFLGNALLARGMETELMRVPWAERGWPGALRQLRQRAGSWRGKWVLVQYTPLAWSGRGFPLRFIRVMKMLREAGVRAAVVFHDVEPYSGRRMVDEMRRRSQLHTMQRALHYADLGVFTVALKAISWLGDPPFKAVFIPVGANLPASSSGSRKSAASEEDPLCVAVFGIAGGAAGREESARIVDALRFAAKKPASCHCTRSDGPRAILSLNCAKACKMFRWRFGLKAYCRRTKWLKHCMRRM